MFKFVLHHPNEHLLCVCIRDGLKRMLPSFPEWDCNFCQEPPAVGTDYPFALPKPWVGFHGAQHALIEWGWVADVTCRCVLVIQIPHPAMLRGDRVWLSDCGCQFPIAWHRIMQMQTSWTCMRNQHDDGIALVCVRPNCHKANLIKWCLEGLILIRNCK